MFLRYMKRFGRFKHFKKLRLNVDILCKMCYNINATLKTQDSKDARYIVSTAQGGARRMGRGRGLEDYDRYSGLTSRDKDRIAMEAFLCGMDVSYDEGGSIRVIGDASARLRFRERMARKGARADNY